MAEQNPPSGTEPPRPPMYSGNKYEKEEKQEKEDEQKEKEEKGTSDRLGTLAWALILIFAGIVLLGVNSDAFTWLNWDTAWSVIFIGAGLIIALEVLARFLLPEYRRPLRGRMVLAVIFIAIGVGNFVGWGAVWPIVLIVIGVSILFGALIR